VSSGLPDQSTHTPLIGDHQARRRKRIRLLVAGLVVLAPVLWLIASNGAGLVSALIDPSGTCWSKVSDTQWIFPFELSLVLLWSSLEMWGPIVLLAVFMFTFFEWLRFRDLAAIVAVYGVAFCLLAYQTGWIAWIYMHQYQIGCI
jgi:hypothetical protein